MDKSTKIVLLQQWSAEVAACNQSEMLKDDWCWENGINPKTYYYHQRMVCRDAFEALPIPAEEQEVHFLEIPQDISADTKPVPAERESASAVIHIGDVQLFLTDGIFETMLKKLLKAARDVTCRLPSQRASRVIIPGQQKT